MSIKELFLAHHSRYRDELHYIAAELRLRGVVPWVDKDGGFEVADECEAEARRAIRENCFGLILYATKSAFGRWFITNVELDEARKMYDEAKAAGGHFDFFAVPRRISYRYLAQKSKEIVGMSLADMNTVSIPESAGIAAWRYRTPEAAERARDLFVQKATTLASEISLRVIRKASEAGDKSSISLQFRTRGERMPDKPDDVLFIDAGALCADDIPNEGQWERLARGLVDVRKHIASFYGRPRIHVHGSKHTTAAFLFGRVFARYPLDIQQKPTDQPKPIWASDIPDPGQEPFTARVVARSGVQMSHSVTPGRAMFIEIAVGHKNVSAAVDAFISSGALQPVARLQLRGASGPLDVDNSLCRSMVRQTYTELEKAVKGYQPTELHLFMSGHMSYTMMLGREFRGMPPVHLYEWDGNNYVHTYCVAAGI